MKLQRKVEKHFVYLFDACQFVVHIPLILAAILFHFYLVCCVRFIHCSSAIVNVCCSLCRFWRLQCQWNDISISTTTIELLFERASAHSLARSHTHISICKLNIGCLRVHSPSHTTIFLWHRLTFKWNWWQWWQWWHHEQAFASFFSLFTDAIAFTREKKKTQWVNKTKSVRQQTPHVLRCFTPLHRLTQSNWNSNLNLSHQYHISLSPVFLPPQDRCIFLSTDDQIEVKVNATSTQQLPRPNTHPQNVSREMQNFPCQQSLLYVYQNWKWIYQQFSSSKISALIPFRSVCVCLSANLPIRDTHIAHTNYSSQCLIWSTIAKVFIHKLLRLQLHNLWETILSNLSVVVITQSIIFASLYRIHELAFAA